MTRSKSKETDVSAPARPNDGPAHLAEEINQELEKGKEHSRLLVEHMLRFVREIYQIGDAGLHAKGHFVLADPGRDFRVVHGIGVDLVQGLNRVDNVSLAIRGDPIRIAHIQHRVALGV